MNCARPVAPEEYNLAGSKNHTVAIAKIAFEIITIPSLNKSSKACFFCIPHNYLTSSPGLSFETFKSSNSSSAASAAQRSIPHDSSPLSLTGCKFFTTTTFLPTKSEGSYHLEIPDTI